jgi:hypothetical protein
MDFMRRISPSHSQQVVWPLPTCSGISRAGRMRVPNPPTLSPMF